MNKKKRAFTLIELIITLALITVILGAIYTFFITNTKSLSKIELNSELQTEAQNIQKEFLNYGTQSEGIIEIETDNAIYNEETLYKNILDTEGKVNIKNIKFKIEDKYYKFIFYKDSGILSLKAVDENDNEVSVSGLPKILSKNVKEFKIRPLDYRNNYESGTFKKAEAIEIIIILSKKKGYSEVETPSSLIVKFRNK